MLYEHSVSRGSSRSYRLQNGDVRAQVRACLHCKAKQLRCISIQRPYCGFLLFIVIWMMYALILFRLTIYNMVIPSWSLKSIVVSACQVQRPSRIFPRPLCGLICFNVRSIVSTVPGLSQQFAVDNLTSIPFLHGSLGTKFCYTTAYRGAQMA